MFCLGQYLHKTPPTRNVFPLKYVHIFMNYSYFIQHFWIVLIKNPDVSWRKPWLMNSAKLITTHKQSCGQVMSSQVSVCSLHASRDRSHGKVPTSCLDIRAGDLPPQWLLVVIAGDLLKLVHLRTYPLFYWHLVVATKVGGTPPTGMLSCSRILTV